MNFEVNLTADGNKPIGPITPGRRYNIRLKGDYGSTTATVSVQDGPSKTGSFDNLSGGVFSGSGATANEGFQLAATEGWLNANVSGSTSPALRLIVIEAED